MAKTNKPVIRVHDVSNNEIIDRQMTDAEFDAWQLDQENQAIAKAEADAKEIAKAAILDRIGLTADELKTILG